MIRLDEVWRTYAAGGRAVHALAGVTEGIEAGEHVAIMGPSGSGKSTLLNVLGCLDRPTSGSYRLDGREVGSLSESELALVRRQSFGHVFQSYHLVPRLDAAANVELPMVFAGLPRAGRPAAVAAALEAVGLADRRDHRPAQLSGGEQQRVAIARAMILRPRVLLADEPTGNLDSASGGQILDLLERLHGQGLTLVVVTHDPSVARRARRVLVMQDGRIAASLPGRELTTVAEALAARVGRTVP
ncbi:MAG TPA: ABC transporter ATP-binding protein [Planctomycetota bacterium]|nr:ABC transporter ATP-binding protein [Planctomycetota bacterium]